MSTLVLPADSVAPSYSFEVELEGALYRIALHWNERDGAWFLSLYDRSGVLLVAGRKVGLGANLLGRGVDARLPPGTVLVVDTSQADVDPGRNDLGARCPLLYVESSGP